MARIERHGDVRSRSTDERRRRHRVWALATGLVALGGMLAVLERHMAAPDYGVGRVPLLVLTGLFALAEALAVHIKFRQDSHSFSLSEIALVFGLYGASADQLAIAQVLGGALVLAGYRRQPPVKLLFNIGLYAVSVLVTVPVFRMVVGHADALGPRGWLAAALATAVSSAVAVPAIYLAVSISDGRPVTREFLRPAGFSVFNAVLTCNIGLAAVQIMRSSTAAEVLLVMPAIGLYLANRAYVSERERHHSLQFLYESTQVLHQSTDLDVALEALMVQTSLALRADDAYVAYRTADGGVVCLGCSSTGEGGSLTSTDADALVELEGIVAGAGGSLLFESGRVAAIVERLTGGRVIRNGVAVCLRGETRVVGALVVANHVSEVSGFEAGDVRLLATLGVQMSVALENGRLEHSLAALKVLESQLTYQATHDPLTGMANRSLFATQLRGALAESSDGAETAVLFIDIDDFKTVNDSLGHAAGDELLVAVAQRLRRAIGPTDLAARLGGDEFALLLRNVEEANGASEVAGRVLSSLAGEFSVAGHRIAVHASIGIALSGDDADPDAMMRNADTAMYSAKASGKGRWVLFSQEIHDALVRRQKLTKDMVAALENGEFKVHFQPMIDLRTGQVVAAEALVRWHHPERGLLMPAEFLGLAEETGHISRLTQTVLLQACRHAAAWHRSTERSAPAVTVNLSARDFDNADLVEMVLQALEDSGLEPGRLILEITETLMLADTDRSVAMLEQLVQAGVRIALDDFGTGYSSLSYLSHLPLHWVKIAKSFVDDLGTQASHDALAQAIVEMGHLLGLGIVAEGIERADQLQALRRFGCDLGQGYLYSRPMGASDFSQWLEPPAIRQQPVEPAFPQHI